jgi:hypothetical protein
MGVAKQVNTEVKAALAVALKALKVHNPWQLVAGSQGYTLIIQNWTTSPAMEEQIVGEISRVTKKVRGGAHLDVKFN